MKKLRYLSQRKSRAYKAGIVAVLILLIAIPIAIRQSQKPTISRSNATASTRLSFSQINLQANTGDTISSDIMLDPGSNMVAFVSLVIDYDNTKVQPATNGLTPNSTAFPAVMQDAQYNICQGNQCKMTIALSVGSNPTSAITTPTKVATVNFTAVAPTDQTGTQITFDNTTEILSIAAADAANENVLSTSTPLSVLINGQGTINPTPTSCPGCPTPTVNPSLTPGQSVTPPIGSVSPGSNDLIFDLKLTLFGIGINGANQHPLHPARKLHVVFYSMDTGQTYPIDTFIVFDGKYFVRHNFDAGIIPPGNYQIYVRSPMYLTTRLLQSDGTTTFVVNDPASSSQIFSVPPNTLIGGDIANADLSTYGDDVLDILDYNTLIGCYKQKFNTSSCTNKVSPDIDDNGIVDGIDYNIWLKSISITSQGDSIPVVPAVH